MTCLDPSPLACSGGSRVRYSGIRCRLLVGRASVRVGVCQRHTPGPRPVGRPPRVRWAILDALTRQPRTTVAVATRAGLDTCRAGKALRRMLATGAVLRTPPAHQGDCARWRLP